MTSKGYKATKEQKEKRSLRMTGKNNPFYGKHHTKEAIENISSKQKGQRHSINTEFIKGSIAWNNNGGKFEDRYIRRMKEYIQWRSDIFERDNWTCQTCGKRGCYLEAHHVKQFITIIKEYNIESLEDARNCEELWQIENGVTLCLDCHNLTKRGRRN